MGILLDYMKYLTHEETGYRSQHTGSATFWMRGPFPAGTGICPPATLLARLWDYPNSHQLVTRFKATGA
jgi:hypothetical protein